MTTIPQHVLIIGAGHGLGQHITTECQKVGWRTIAIGSSLAPRDGENEPIQIQCDLRHVQRTPIMLSGDDPYTARELAITLGEFPPVQHLFWVAGTHDRRPFEHLDADAIERLINVNLTHALILVRRVFAGMARRYEDTAPGPYSITIISSTSGLLPRLGEEIYAATKWAQVGFARSLRCRTDRLRADGTSDIRIHLFCPGGMRTALYDGDSLGRPADYDQFMDPAKVAAHVVPRVAHAAMDLDETIDRKSALGLSLR
ncbi:SDR family NAD(P)-dependent oxidoreductase [Candidatus Uhrbacteria bacterium]|nr:SDR family NAD(P)-dependent oxidoreductase [Candidatus Uhrbacteria bacterium]